MKLLLLSGGLDSACAFWDMLSKGEVFCCMFFDYGQKNADREYAAALKLCSANGIVLKKLDVHTVFSGIKSTILRGVEAEHTVTSDELQNRNAVLISIAAAHCTSRTTIIVAAHRTSAPYADCTPQFYTRMSKLTSWSTNGLVDVDAPYIRITKLALARKGWSAGMSKQDMLNTVSCYEGTNCGKCPACQNRQEVLSHIFY